MNESRATSVYADAGRAKLMTAAGVVWVCAAQFFVAQVIAQSRWTTPFSLATNFISDLGNTNCGPYPDAGGPYVCSPWHALMNASFVIQGLIVMAGAALARPSLAGRRWAAAAFVLLVVTGLGIAGVGLFPEDVSNAAHVISAGVQFVTGNAAVIVCGVGLRRRERAFGVISTALGVAGLLATVLFVQGYGLGLGVAGMERVAAYTLPLWLIMSGVLMVRGKHGDHTPHVR
jgi:hypothetical membrane protein